MATIDKALPNVTRTKIEIPSPQKKAQEIQLPQEPPKQPIEITRTEDGGAEIDFDPSAMANIGGAGQNIDTNLAEFLDDDITDPIGSDMMQNFEDYKASRDDWEQGYIKGLDLLGFKYEDRTEPFQGASGATHPVLAEAVTQFQSLAYKELLPADGPIRS